jgi:tetraacyldisaccharide 4'-kinase
MRAPAFWWRPDPSPLATLLRPAAAAYAAVAVRRMRQPGATADVPVICVGNFTVGGAGKTPAALTLAHMLAAEGHKPFFLTRGYGGRLAGPVRVDPAAHKAGDVGDEPLLLARAFPTIVARDRRAGAQLAAGDGAGVVVMDDGLQNPSLAKDLSFAVVDGATGSGNGLCLPAGPLRAPLAAQWPKVDAVIVVGDGAPLAVINEAEVRSKPVLRARLEPEATHAAPLRGRRVLAFAGIGRPDKFFATLRECGATVVAERRFSDHHPYRADEIRAILAEAQANGLDVVTTEKDLVRIASLPDVPFLTADIKVLPVHLVFEESMVQDLLSRALAQGKSRRA